MSWVDVLSLVATVVFFGGIIYAIIFVTKSINEGVASTKESLKSKGFDVSASGMSVKTSKRFGREDYVDATQRGMLKAFQASSFRRNASESSEHHPSESIQRTASSSSTTSSEEKKKRRGLLGSRK